MRSAPPGGETGRWLSAAPGASWRPREPRETLGRRVGLLGGSAQSDEGRKRSGGEAGWPAAVGR